MTISDELKIKFNKQVRRLIYIFIKEFIKVKEREEFDDNRKVLFLDGTKNPLKPFYFGNGEKKEESKKPKSFKTWFSAQYKQDKVIIRIYCSEIHENTFFHTSPEIFFSNLDFFENLFKQIAHHEYGHSFLTETEFDAYPQNVRNFLIKFNYRDLDDVPPIKNGELNEAFKKDKYGEIDNLGLVEGSLKEFHSNYYVKKKINGSIPDESLRKRRGELKLILSDLSERKEKYYNSQELGMKKFSNQFFKVLTFTQEFYIFNEWNKLEVVFDEHKFNEMLGLFHKLNKIFKKIIEKNWNFDEMRDDIFELAKVLDNFNYEKIFFKNLIVEKDLILLNKFIDELKNENIRKE